ncbi:MAG: ABC transporter ATP-binding protein [Desulfovibrio sp.]
MAQNERGARPFLRPGGPGARFAEAERAADARGTLRRLFGYFAGEKPAVAGVFISVALATLFGVLAPLLQSRAIDILAGTEQGRIGSVLLLMTAVYLLYCGAKLLQGRLSAGLSQRLVLRLRAQIFGKLVRLPVPYMDSHSHGDVMSRMTNDVESLSSAASMSLPSVFSGVLMIAGASAAMFWSCWQLALVSFASMLLTAVATRLLSGPVRRCSRTRQALLGELNGRVEEFVSGYRTVTACGRGERSAEEFCAVSDRLLRAGIQADALSGIFGPLANAVSNLTFIIVTVCGGYFAVEGIISVGVISAFLVYARLLGRPVNELAMVAGQLMSAVAAAERVFAMLDEAEEDMGGEDFRPGGGAGITFEGVSFGYVPGRDVLKDVSFSIPAGQKAALVGSSGSGKTTVANLLMRFYEPGRGRILVGGQDIAKVSRSSLRRSMDIVLQDVSLLSDTVRVNLGYAREGASDGELWLAAERGRCSALIRMLPQGMDTVLEASGASLSQGERQLLSIARSFAADPDVLILDEATASVDTRTEKEIQAAMREVMLGRTAIIIAHRLSTIRDADIILVMDGGRIVEKGRHGELMTRRGRYWELCRLQLAGRET